MRPYSVYPSIASHVKKESTSGSRPRDQIVRINTKLISRKNIFLNFELIQKNKNMRALEKVLWQFVKDRNMELDSANLIRQKFDCATRAFVFVRLHYLLPRPQIILTYINGESIGEVRTEFFSVEGY